ncbi:MAG TPA: nucleotidyltransferase domain-containing protein [Bacillota bacterium]|nr:nucleotidyltransferase domain-containing protein [Bacillota bacterium]
MDNSRNLGKIAEILVDYFKNGSLVVSAYIFGSFGTKEQTPLSDLDIAVLFTGEISLMEELRHTGEISSLLGLEKVDFINLNKAPVHLQHEVLLKGTKIFDGKPELTQDFVERVLEIYHDYQGIINKYRADFHESLIEEYLNGR